MPLVGSRETMRKGWLASKTTLLSGTALLCGLTLEFLPLRWSSVLCASKDSDRDLPSVLMPERSALLRSKMSLMPKSLKRSLRSNEDSRSRVGNDTVTSCLFSCSESRPSRLTSFSTRSKLVFFRLGRITKVCALCPRPASAMT